MEKIILFSGGNRVEERMLATNDSHGMDRRQSLRIPLGSGSHITDQSTDCKKGQQHDVVLMPDKIRCFAVKGVVRTRQLDSQFVKGHLNLASFMINSWQFLTRGLVQIQDCYQVLINKSRSWRPFELVFCHTDKARSIATTLSFLRASDVAHTGNTRQSFPQWHIQLLFDHPQKHRTIGLDSILKLKSGKALVGETRHFFLQEFKNSLNQCRFACLMVPYLEAKKQMGPIFHQKSKLKLRIGTLFPAWCSLSESLFMPHIPGASIPTRQSRSYPVISPPCLLRSSRRPYLVMPPLQRLRTQLGLGLGDPGLPRHFHRRLQQPLNSLQQIPQYLKIDGARVQSPDDDIIDYNVSRQNPFVNAGFSHIREIPFSPSLREKSYPAQPDSHNPKADSVFRAPPMSVRAIFAPPQMRWHFIYKKCFEWTGLLLNPTNLIG